MSEKHKLAAIVFTDIVGYTQQMDADEQQTMKLLERQKEIVYPIVESYQGQVLKEIGDGLLMMFDSAIQAVKCVIAFQKELKDEEFSVRAGIHIGDIIFKDGDVFGSAVNIAARIEPMAQPNGICVSESVTNQLRNQKDIFLKGIGEKNLKGVSEPVKLYEVLMEKPEHREMPKLTVWQHLWRRRIPQVFGTYIVVSAIILFVINWAVQQYALSPYLFQFALIALLSLIPGIFLVAYLHGRPGTRQVKNIERIALPANLLITALILFFMFKGKDLGATTQSVVLTTEDGQKIEREIVKSEFRKNLLIFFFDNSSGDTALDWLQYGVADMLEHKMYQDMYINAMSGYTMHIAMSEAGYDKGVGIPLTLKQQFSDRFHKNFFVSGTIQFEDGEYVIDYGLYKTESGKKVAGESFRNSDLFEIIDLMGLSLKSGLDLPAKYIEETQDLPISEMYSKSVDAVKYHILGKISWSYKNDWKKLLYYQDLAVDKDSSFAMAYVYILNACIGGNLRQKMEETFDLLMTYRHKLPEIIQFEIRSAYYSLYKGDNDKAFSVIKMWRDLYPDDIMAHQKMAEHYQQKGQTENIIDELKIILELDPERSEYLLVISDNYLILDDVDQAYAYLDSYVKKYPDNIRSYKRLGRFYRRTGDLEKAMENYETALLIEPSDVSAQINLAEVALAMGEFDKIEGIYNDVLKICRSSDEKADVYHALAAFYEITGQVERCIETKLLEYAEREKYVVAIQLNITKGIELGLYSLAGRPEDGLAQIPEIKSHLMPPFDRFISLAYVSIYFELDNADSIRNVLPDVEYLIDSMKYDLIQNFVYLAKARIEELDGNYEEAAEYYINIKELETDSQGIDVKIGRCYREAGKENKAEKYLMKALVYSPANPLANLEMALLYHQKGDTEKAREYLNVSLNAWKHADPQFKYGLQALELNEELGGAAL